METITNENIRPLIKEYLTGTRNFPQIGTWDVSRVTDMSKLFVGLHIHYLRKFDEHLDSWITSQVTTMEGMFYGCETFNQSLSHFDTSRVENMSYMFFGCKKFDKPLNRMQSFVNVGLALSAFIVGYLVENYGYFLLELYFTCLSMSKYSLIFIFDQLKILFLN
jgi:surface protein